MLRKKKGGRSEQKKGGRMAQKKKVEDQSRKKWRIRAEKIIVGQSKKGVDRSTFATM